MDLSEAPFMLNRHPWELSRVGMISRLVASRLTGKNVGDVGAGDAYFAKYVAARFGARVTAVDPHFSATGLIAGIECLASLDSIPPESLDVAFLMDVLEHVEDDALLLREAVAKVRPGGLLLITVPVWRILFSSHDGTLKHHRRYDPSQFSALLSSIQGLRVDKTFGFYFSLFLLRFMQVTFMGLRGAGRPQLSDGNLPDRGDDDEVDASQLTRWPWAEHNWITKVCTAALNFDFVICKLAASLGLRLPGLSMVSLCTKK